MSASLLAAGAWVRAYDPEAMHEAAKLYADRSRIAFCESKEAAVEGADALVICTEWKPFRAPDFAKLGQAMTAKLIFDGRNLYDPAVLAREGWQYYAIGRGLTAQAAT
ncbi:MAG: hypothetical protein JHC61_12170 [Burkholderiaceae bacterium]|nr:hypothetical protein [Burkholderiaceae bacterium]